MGLSFYYSPRSQNILHAVTYLNTSYTAKIWSMELENTKSLWKILIESEKITKILE